MSSLRKHIHRLYNGMVDIILHIYQRLVWNKADGILLKDYQPVSRYNIPKTEIQRAKYPVIDFHSHDYVSSTKQIEVWIDTMDACGVEKVHLQHCAWIGRSFEECMKAYESYKDRFAFWCSFDYANIDTEEGLQKSMDYLEHCKALGAVGVGEIGDKGDGDLYARPVEGRGIHLDDSRIQPLLRKCGELKMPVSVHVAEPIWSYMPADFTNEKVGGNQIGSKPNRYNYAELITSFENAVRENSDTIFIGCHWLNMTHDLAELGRLLDKYKNLYIDLSARITEIAVIPRTARKFMIRYQDRILYATDSGDELEDTRAYFRILETADEHFYLPHFRQPHYYSGLHLPDAVLKKIYRDNAIRLLTEYK